MFQSVNEQVRRNHLEVSRNTKGKQRTSTGRSRQTSQTIICQATSYTQEIVRGAPSCGRLRSIATVSDANEGYASHSSYFLSRSPGFALGNKPVGPTPVPHKSPKGSNRPQPEEWDRTIPVSRQPTTAMPPRRVLEDTRTPPPAALSKNRTPRKFDAGVGSLPTVIPPSRPVEPSQRAFLRTVRHRTLTDGNLTVNFETDLRSPFSGHALTETPTVNLVRQRNGGRTR